MPMFPVSGMVKYNREHDEDCGMSELSELYDKNYTAWARRMAELLKAGEFSRLDVGHLVEELEDMGKSEQRELESRLRVLLSHLLKWQFQYRQLSERWKDFDGRSWRNTIENQRTEIQINLRKYPGVKKFLPDTIMEAYEDAKELARKETRLPIETFPQSCPYSQAQILEDDFYPPQE
jgi:hypothetical protein